MKFKYVIYLLVLFQTININAALMIQNSESVNTKIFYTDEDKQGRDAYIVGKVLSLGQREINKSDLNQSAQEKTKVTVRLYSNNNLRKGQILYVINERNLIVSRIKVEKIYKSISFGYLLIGYGNFRRVQEDFRVAAERGNIKASNAYIYKSRGDYFFKKNNISKAIQMYEKAINADKTYAEAHLMLGKIYLNKKIYSYAKKEYSLAYDYLWHVYDNQDKFDILLGMIRVRYNLAYESGLGKGNQLRNKYVNEGIKYSKEALELNKNSVELNFLYGYFLYNNANPNDSEAKNRMLFVLKNNKNHLKANIILARLYYKHKNQDKAIEYAQKALKIDPSDLEAKETYRKVSIPL